MSDEYLGGRYLKFGLGAYQACVRNGAIRQIDMVVTAVT